MSFQLLNPSDERGDYAFQGKALTSDNCNMTLSQEEIEAIKTQIQEYTDDQARDYVLIFKNGDGELLYAIDNLSSSDMEEMRSNGTCEEHIQAMNYYTLMMR